jgi:Aminoglycoside adenylyltransferase, C-terminal domain/Nucleotidyltransferase domain
MDDSLSPTPFVDVNIVLHDFLVKIQFVLRDQFVGFYLYGSLALGDFDPLTSDIDFIVLTREAIGENHLGALREMHTIFNQSNLPWSRKIEAAYIPLDALHQSISSTALYPQIEKETDLILSPLEIGWSFQRHTLREHGVTVAGPSPQSLIDPVDQTEMNKAAAVILRGWENQSLHDPSWIAWARQRGSQAFIILTICRIRYSLETGDVASKPEAARWAKATLEPRWIPLIDRALTSPHDEQENPDSDFDEILAFLHDTLVQLE